MARCFRYLTLVLAALWVSRSLFAETAERPTVDLEFSAFSLRALKAVSFEAEPGQGPTTVQFYTPQRSPRYAYRGPNPVIFFREERSPLDPLRTIRVPLARATIPEGVHEPLFLFFPRNNPQAPAGQLPYEVYVLDDSWQNFPPRHLLFFNASERRLEGLVGQERLTLEPGLSRAVRVDQRVEVQFKLLFRERFHTTYAHTLSLNPRERVLILFFPPYYADSLEVQYRILREEKSSQEEKGEAFDPNP